MKKYFFLLIIICVTRIDSNCQAPGKFNYQAVARNTGGNLILNQSISVRVSILSGNATGTTEYSETHPVTTDAFGVFNLLIGGGIVISGSFNSITWGTASKYLKVEADVTGGTTYQPIATTQILSMPYALYANESGTKTFNDNEFRIINQGGITEDPSVAPVAVLAGMGAGNVDDGVHDYKVTFVTTAGESGAGPASANVTVANKTINGKIFISGIPVSGKTNVISRNIYRRFNSSGDYKLLITLNDNSTTSYIDNVTNASLGKVIPALNGTTNGFQFDASGLTTSQSLKIPNTSGTLVINEGTSVPVQTKADRSLVLHGRSVIQSLINGNYYFGANSGEFGEAYVDADGKNNSVDIGTTTGFFETNKYRILKTTDPIFSNNAEYYSSSLSPQLTSTNTVNKKASSISINLQGNRSLASCYLLITYADLTTETSGTFNKWDWGYQTNTYTVLKPNITISTIAVWQWSNSGDIGPNSWTKDLIIYAYTEGAVQIDHGIPIGTFASNISSAFGIPLIADSESGANIRYKLTNAGGDDSGWLEFGVVSSFTQFTHGEPTKLSVSLIPKSSSPTAGYPSVYGFYITEF
jgi:hypothetical protein